MITYKKNSLATRIIRASEVTGSTYYTHFVAKKVSAFIENANYKRIVDISYFGNKDNTLVCIIIYEKGKTE